MLTLVFIILFTNHAIFVEIYNNSCMANNHNRLSHYNLCYMKSTTTTQNPFLFWNLCWLINVFVLLRPIDMSFWKLIPIF